MTSHVAGRVDLLAVQLVRLVGAVRLSVAAPVLGHTEGHVFALKMRERTSRTTYHEVVVRVASLARIAVLFVASVVAVNVAIACPILEDALPTVRTLKLCIVALYGVQFTVGLVGAVDTIALNREAGQGRTALTCPSQSQLLGMQEGRLPW